MDNKTAFNVNQYDENVRKVIPFYDEINHQSLDLIRTYFGDRGLALLDTGCGTGSFGLTACKYLPLSELRALGREPEGQPAQRVCFLAQEPGRERKVSRREYRLPPVWRDVPQWQLRHRREFRRTAASDTVRHPSCGWC